VCEQYRGERVESTPIEPPVQYWHATLRSGRHVQIVLNRDTGLLVVDVVRPDERGGNECVRKNLDQVELITDAELHSMFEEKE
jgi:hypothetical protein